MIFEIDNSYFGLNLTLQTNSVFISGLHRYVFLVFKQPGKINYTESHVDKKYVFLICQKELIFKAFRFGENVKIILLKFISEGKIH